MEKDIYYIENELDSIKQDIYEAYKNKEYYKSICLLKFVTNMYYTINNKLTDDFVEEMVVNVSNELIGQTTIITSEEKKVLFYDGFGVLNRGLANIYIEALIQLDYNIEWILYEFQPDVDKIINKYSEVKFIVIPKSNIIERMQILKNEIIMFAPKHIFVYTTPDDVGGLGVLSTVTGNVYRYLIDLTDHAYWLGKKSIDYCLGFRNIGCNAAIKMRGINKDNVLMIPYYPEKREKYKFMGLPFNDNRDFIFSGGSSYKTEGSNEYFEIIDNILKKYSDLCFVYACNDCNESLKKIEKKYPGRAFIIKERKDLDKIMQHAKFYYHTYPMLGGLMVQYAVENKCVPFGLCLKSGGMTDPKTFLLNTDNVFISSDCISEVYSYFDRLMESPNFYENEKQKLKGLIISKDDFVTQVSHILEEQRTDFAITDEEVDMTRFFEINNHRMTKEKYFKCVKKSGNIWLKEKYKL